MGRESLFMTFIQSCYGFATIFSLCILSSWKFALYAERQQWWTLRLRLSLWQPYVLALWLVCSSIAIAFALYSLRSAILADSTYPCILYNVVDLAIGAIIIMCGDGALRALESRHFLRLRWKCWSGPSRTRISPGAARYIGNSDDWAILSANAEKAQQHPVEKFAGFILPYAQGIGADPTDLLRIRVAQDQEERSLWTTSSQEMTSVFQPIVNNQSVSLLWGEHLGFQRRCSRGIISVPVKLLTASPLLKSGVSANSICLAYGILARNKGLEPATLICNLRVKNSFGLFEEAGLWPHPAKTLRGLYYSEFNTSFSLLGQSYVTAATELALLLAGLDRSLISEWLDSMLEHQDLSFNLEVHALGGSLEDLQRLYRGQYAAMLASLSLYHSGIRIRPELLVFDAVCKAEHIEPPFWTTSDAMVARRKLELDIYGPTLLRLVDAVI